MRIFLIVAMLVVGVLAAAMASYWFFEATNLPVADTGQQAVQVLYNVHAAIWTLIAVVGFGFAGLMARRTDAATAGPSVRAEPGPGVPVERPASGPRGPRERVEPRL